MNRYLIIPFLFFISSFSFAQRCAIVDSPGNQVKILQNLTKNESIAGIDTMRIPVVFHIIAGQSYQSYLTDQKVINQLAILNRDFNRLNEDTARTHSDFKRIAKGMPIKFVLARADPSRNPTTGIVRSMVNQQYPIDAQGTYKMISSWPSKDYLNVWVVNSSNAYVGFATFPGQTAYPEGVTVAVKAFEYGTYPFNLGRTLTHEVGHYFGLYHIWGDKTDCSGTDFIEDTPPQAGATTGLPSYRPISCDPTKVKMFENYMDYTDDVGMNMFSSLQVFTMDAIARSARAELINNFATKSVGTIDRIPPDSTITNPDTVISVPPPTPPSDPVVPEVVVGTETTNSFAVWQEQGEVVVQVEQAMEEAPVAIYTIQGVIIAKGRGSCRLSLAGESAGIYIVMVGIKQKRIFNP